MNLICGIYSPSGPSYSPGDPSGLNAMLAALVPALPGGSWTDPEVGVGLGFAHSRFTPLPKALHCDPEAGLTAVVDARLDDREGFCDALGLNRSQSADLADSELLLRGYRRWAGELPKHLFGDYAFAIWDARKRVLFCARDPMGVKPFYYSHSAATGRFAFAGLLDAVLAAPEVSAELDEVMVARALTRAGMDEAKHTFFKDIAKLPPGHSLTLTVGVAGRSTLALARHWQPESAPAVRRTSDDDYAEEFLFLCTQAVASRLGGADPIGAHLSGGLDSSSIAVLAARELRRSGRPAPLAFSWLPDLAGKPPSEAHAPEYDAIDAVCRQEGLKVFHRAPNADDMVRVLRLDGARPGVHVLASEEVVQRCAAEQGVNVLLSGWGGDQGASFNGRGHRAHLLLSGRWRQFAALGRAVGRPPLQAFADAALPLVHPDAQRWLRRLLRGADHSRSDFSDEPWLRRWLVHPALARRTRVEPRRRSRQFTMRQALLWDLGHGAIQERIEGWAAGGAQHGTEYRYPLLDRRLLQFVLGLPPEQFLRGQWNRWLMRYALRGALPASILWNRSKHDPARYDPMFNTFTESLPLVRKLIEQREVPPSRACYLDMPRLLDWLDADRFGAEPRWASILCALQFLDF